MYERCSQVPYSITSIHFDIVLWKKVQPLQQNKLYRPYKQSCNPPFLNNVEHPYKQTSFTLSLENTLNPIYNTNKILTLPTKLLYPSTSTINKLVPPLQQKVFPFTKKCRRPKITLYPLKEQSLTPAYMKKRCNSFNKTKVVPFTKKICNRHTKKF